jgi:hypothetical protein
MYPVAKCSNPAASEGRIWGEEDDINEDEPCTPSSLAAAEAVVVVVVVHAKSGNARSGDEGVFPKSMTLVSARAVIKGGGAAGSVCPSTLVVVVVVVFVLLEDDDIIF